MASDALSLTDVNAFYGDSHILHGVSFSLQAGAVLALLGRNGAGKTTCISTIVGFLKPKTAKSGYLANRSKGSAPSASRISASAWCRRDAASFPR